MLVVWMTCLDDPWYEGLLTKLFSLHVVDLCDSFCLARLVIEPLSGYGGSCLRATVCSTAIERGGVLVAPRWASLRWSGCYGPKWSGPDTPFKCAPRHPAFSSGSWFFGALGSFWEIIRKRTDIGEHFTWEIFLEYRYLFIHKKKTCDD
jgi:hypothetical protein